MVSLIFSIVCPMMPMLDNYSFMVVSLEERLLEQAGIYMKYSVVATTRSRQDFRREKARRRNRLPFGHYSRAKRR